MEDGKRKALEGSVLARVDIDYVVRKDLERTKVYGWDAVGCGDPSLNQISNNYCKYFSADAHISHVDNNNSHKHITTKIR